MCNPPKKTSHSPNWENVAWDTQSVLRDLQEWPEGRVTNWSEFARLHQVPGKNARQVVKEFAQINVLTIFVNYLEKTSTVVSRQ